MIMSKALIYFKSIMSIVNLYYDYLLGIYLPALMACNNILTSYSPTTCSKRSYEFLFICC